MVFTYRKAKLVPMRGRVIRLRDRLDSTPQASIARRAVAAMSSLHSPNDTATGGWDAERQFFETRGDLFVATRTVKARVKSLRAFHEFDHQPPGLLGSFPGCVVRRVTH